MVKEMICSIERKSKNVKFAEIILTVCLFLVGTFHEYISCFVSLIMISWLAYKIFTNKELNFSLNTLSLSIILMVFFYGVTAFWAVDSGMAVIGFVKFLPVLLYLLILMQYNNISDIIERIPIVAAFMTLVSSILMQIPFLKDFFSVAGRLSGFFEYPNTFAIFLLVSELIIVSREKFKVFDYVLIAILLFGIFYSGSRTVFILLIISNAVIFLKSKKSSIKLFIIAIFLLFVIAAVLYTFISKNMDSFTRFLKISINESTFLGRILYFQDALPIILKRPFGLGYMGYYYMQQSIQTGVYSVKYIHNDFLQLFLDIGWIPTLLFIVSVLKSVFCKKMILVKNLYLWLYRCICVLILIYNSYQYLCCCFCLPIIIPEN